MVLLGVTNFGYDLGPRTLRTLLLRYTEICTLEIGGTTVLARRPARALDLPAMARITGLFDGRGRGNHCWRKFRDRTNSLAGGIMSSGLLVKEIAVVTAQWIQS